MKFGVLSFSYAGFAHFQAELTETGSFTANLGDFAQTIASRRLLERLGAPADSIVQIDRDSIAHYDGPPVVLVMNAVFQPRAFPLPPAITPVFLGFTMKPDLLAEAAPHLAAHAPIGCRDLATADGLRALGIPAFVSGCVTLTLRVETARAPRPKPFVVYGGGAGRLPAGLLGKAPASLLDSAEFIYHRTPMFEWPLSVDTQRGLERYEELLFHRLAAEASIVITPLHHIAAPAMAIGLPTVLARHDDNFRFSFLKTLIPVHTPARFSEIDWSPPVRNVIDPAERYEAALRTALRKLDALT